MLEKIISKGILELAVEDVQSLSKDDYALVRKDYFGASDSSVLCGVNLYKNMDELLKEKNTKYITKEEREVGEKAIVRKGYDLEPIILQKAEEEKTIRHHKVEEIKYKTTIKELNDYIEIYKNKISELEETNMKYEKEVMPLRKKILRNETDLSTLKSILQMFVKEYGIDNVVELTKIEKNKIESYMGE